MSWTEAAPAELRPGVLARLQEVCTHRELEGLSGRLLELGQLLADDMAIFERSIVEVPPGQSVVRRSAHHLLGLGGKRLRPMCVMLASRVGDGFDHRGADLAVAVELVHHATLLHDDVVDLGDLRRGAPTARTIYGNAASIFAGDWLLVEALRRVRRSRVPGALEALLDIIEEMIEAEAIQLENRGRLSTDRATWLRVVEGKTAALFRWAMLAGARAGGLDDRAGEALEAYGQHLGVAFQAVDDVLDLTGEAATTGKALFADVREGKMTWPLIVGLERQPSLRPALERILKTPPEMAPEQELQSEVLGVLADTGAVRDCMAFARKHVSQAVAELESLPQGPAVDALVTAAHAAVDRKQ